MYYEINIAKLNKRIGANGRYEHYFATAERSITSKEQLKSVYAELRKAFPEPEFKINVTYWEKIGQPVDMGNMSSPEVEAVKKQITTDYCPRTGLLVVTQHEGDADNERSVFLTKEDVVDIEWEAKKHRLANRADFN